MNKICITHYVIVIPQVQDVSISGGMATFQAQHGGVYVARTDESNVALIVGVTVACAVIVAIAVGAVFYFRRHPAKWQAVRTTCRNAERSLHSKV